MRMAQRSPHRLHRLARQHCAHRLDGHRNDERHLGANRLGELPNSQGRRFDVPSVLAGFHQQHVDSAFD